MAAMSMFNSKTTALEVVQALNVDLNGKIVIITGALASIQAHVIITTRDLNKGIQIIEELKRTTGNKHIEAIEMQLTSLESVRNFVIQFRARQLPIHILISHFLLTTSLLHELKAGKPSRVIVVSSLANKRGDINWNDMNWENTYDKWLAYAQSKTANILFAKQFNRLYESQDIRAYSLQPGGILTNLKQQIPEKQQRAMGWYRDDGTLIDVFKTVQQGAATIVYAADMQAAEQMISI